MGWGGGGVKRRRLLRALSLSLPVYSRFRATRKRHVVEKSGGGGGGRSDARKGTEGENRSREVIVSRLSHSYPSCDPPSFSCELRARIAFLLVSACVL